MIRVHKPTFPVLLTLTALAACGGGGGGGGVTQIVPSATLSTLTASALSAPADGTTEVLLTAAVRDAVGDALGGRAVRFEATGAGAALAPTVAATNQNGIATSRLTGSQPGPVVVGAVVTGGGEVRLATTLTINFVAANAPVVAGPARFEDRNRNAACDAGDAVVVPFSEAVTVNGAVADDFVLPVTDDTFGSGATVAAGPADNEVTITLGAGPRLRSRGRFAAAATDSNEPSGIDVQNGQAIVSVASGTAAQPSQAADIGAGPVAQAPVAPGGQVIAVGDINGDSQPDVVVADNGSFTPLVNVAGVLTAAGPSTGQAANDVVIRNLNRIGNSEVITADAIAVRLWNVSTTGGTPVLVEDGIITTGPANGIDVVDVDLDGFPDVVTATDVGVIVAIHQRNLGNTFAIGQSLFFPAAVQDVLAADLDGDGDPDVLALQAAAVKVLRNDGGTFVPTIDLPATGGERLSAADVDGDGRVDVLLSGQGAATLFVQQSDGSFVGQALTVAADKAELVDLDGDSFADIAAITAAGVEYLQNDRSGGFESLGVEPAASPVDLRTGDLDRDGDQDVVIVDGAAVRALLGSLGGTFGDTVFTAGQDLGADVAGAKQALGDVDGDGNVDRVVTTATGAQIFLGDGLGGFTNGPAFGPGLPAQPTAIALGDMDGDGDLDCVLGFDLNVANNLFLNDGQGQFTFEWGFSGFACRSLALTDFDGDGLLDVFVGNDGDNEVYVNTTSGGSTQLFLEADAFLGTLPQAVGGETIAVIAWDFDREGDEDIVVVNGGDLTSPQDAYVLRRSGTGYTLLSTLNAQLLATAATLGDVDGDGRDDLAIAQLSSNGSATVKWYRGLNTSISTLPTNVASNGQYFSRSLEVVDVDGDGRNDFVIGDVSVSNQPLAVLEQQPNGTFAVGQEFPTTRLEQLAAGDFDRDGDVDLVTVESTGPSRVLLNR